MWMICILALQNILLPFCKTLLKQEEKLQKKICEVSLVPPLCPLLKGFVWQSIFWNTPVGTQPLMCGLRVNVRVGNLDINPAMCWGESSAAASGLVIPSTPSSPCLSCEALLPSYLLLVLKYPLNYFKNQSYNQNVCVCAHISKASWCPL